MTKGTREGKTNRKLFTVDQANACLPLVRAITSDLVDLSRTVVERRLGLMRLMAGHRPVEGDPYLEELVQANLALEEDLTRIQGYIQELLDLGVEPKSATEGLVDFPAMIDGRHVYLCWRLDEPEVMFWHEVDAGFSGRQPLAEEALVGGGVASRP